MSSLTATQSLSRFLRWWQSELAAVLPTRFRQWWAGTDRLAFVRLDTARLTVLQETENTLTPIADVDLATGDTASHRAAVNKAMASAKLQGTSTLVLLAPGSVFTQRVNLPLAVEENLRASLVFEMDRLTPFRADQVYFDYSVAARESTTRQLQVELTVVRRNVVDEALARAATFGVMAAGATTSELQGSRSERLVLGPDVMQTHRDVGRRQMRMVFLALTVVLLLVWIGLPLWQKREAVIALQEPLAQAKAAAGEVANLRDELDRGVAAYNWLPQRKWDRASALLVLDELSRRLGNETYATVLEFDPNGIQMQGESGAAPALVETLENSPMFKDVTFKAQLTKIQGTGNDRFQLAATLEPAARLAPATAMATDKQTPPSSASSSETSSNTLSAAATAAPATQKNASAGGGSK